MARINKEQREAMRGNRLSNIASIPADEGNSVDVSIKEMEKKMADQNKSDVKEQKPKEQKAKAPSKPKKDSFAEKLPKKGPKTNAVSVRLTEQEFEWVSKTCEKYNTSKSDLIETLIKVAMEE